MLSKVERQFLTYTSDNDFRYWQWWQPVSITQEVDVVSSHRQLTSVQKKVIQHVKLVHEIITHRVTVQTFVFAFDMVVFNKALHHLFVHWKHTNDPAGKIHYIIREECSGKWKFYIYQNLKMFKSECPKLFDHQQLPRSTPHTLSWQSSFFC